MYFGTITEKSSIMNASAESQYKQILVCIVIRMYLNAGDDFFPFFAGPKTHSRLIVSDVIKEDSGNYTCSAPNTVSSSIDVFVSPGEKLESK